MKIIHTKVLLILLLMVVLGSCSRMGTLNMKEHSYGILPMRIIWIQIPGLQDEHLALLRFFRPTVKNVTAFEQSECLGKMWTYNLYQVRPGPNEGLLSQILGKKNIKNECGDYAHTPVWRFMIDNGYLSGVFESSPYESQIGQTLDQLPKCEENKNFLKDLIVWQMRPGLDKYLINEQVNKISKRKQKNLAPPKIEALNILENRRVRGGVNLETNLSKTEDDPSTLKTKGPNQGFFHVQEPALFEEDHLYYDRSCQKQGCFTNLFRNVEYIFENFQKNRSQYFFLFRDFTFYKALEDQNIDKVKEALMEIEKIFLYFLEKQQNDSKMLLLLSSTSPLNIEFPSDKSDWEKLELKGESLIFKKSSLLAPVFAKGARSENFCGIYEEAELLQRMSSGPPKIGL